MANFHYEWYTIEIKEPAGWVVIEIKAKDKAGAVKQLERMREKSNSPENKARTPLDPKWIAPVLEVKWETLKLDRIGYQRLF